MTKRAFQLQFSAPFGNGIKSVRQIDAENLPEPVFRPLGRQAQLLFSIVKGEKLNTRIGQGHGRQIILDVPPLGLTGFEKFQSGWRVVEEIADLKGRSRGGSCFPLMENLSSLQ